MQVKLESILGCLVKDCAVDTLTAKYLYTRLKSEGVGLFTVTLPKLAKAVLRSIEVGYFNYSEHIDLRCFARKGRSLRYFRSFLDRIFCKRSGKLLPDACPVTLASLRQLCEYAYKLTTSFGDDQLQKFTDKFIETDEEVDSYAYDWSFVEQLRKDFETYYHEISRATVSQILDYARPRPGSGTFSGDHYGGIPWYVVKATDYDYRPEFKPYSGYFKPYPSAPVTPRGVPDTSEDSELLFVPKDSRGPRAIVREPYRRLYLQMAFHDWITDALEKATHNRVNFRDQTINRRLALESSKDKKNATLDLKEASDRVSYRVISRIFQNSPGCRFMLENRSRYAKFRREGVDMRLKLSKVAGMGSGLTFPTMSLLISLSITRQVRDNLRHLSYKQIRSRIYVYGDDIIVPRQWVDYAYRALSRVGLVVNTSKSYVNSHFRESCGGDYFIGNDVAPVRLKLSGLSVVSSGGLLHFDKVYRSGLKNPMYAYYCIERHCRELVKKGLNNLAEFFYCKIEKSVGRLPYVSGESPVLGRYVEDSADAYITDETGAYETLRVLVPVPRFDDNHLKDPYVVLGSKLRGHRKDILTTIPSGDPSAIAEPRDVKVVRRAVSAFRLIG